MYANVRNQMRPIFCVFIDHDHKAALKQFVG